MTSAPARIVWLSGVVALVGCDASSGAPPDAGGTQTATITHTATTATSTQAVTATGTVAELGGRAMTTFEQELMRHSLDRYTGDLATIREKKVLRVLTRNNSSNYFITNGQERGFQYELAKAFADDLGVRLAVIVPTSRSELEAALVAGEGDMIAAGTTITATRAKRLGFSYAVREAPRVVVLAADNKRPVTTLADLRKLTIHVSFRSTTYSSLVRLGKKLRAPLKLADVEDDVEMEEMIARVAAGDYEATIADRDIVDLAIAGGTAVRAGVEVDAPAKKGWAFRKESVELTKVADAFVRKHRKDGLINIFYGRYYKSRGAARVVREQDLRTDTQGRISRWDEAFRREADRHDLDWRLLAAIAFTESRLDPKAASAWGAVGLMQVLPTTAKAHGVTRLEDPEENIKAGAAYFKYLVDRFDNPAIEVRQRVRFALAAYNAGLGHVFDARALAPRIGRDPNVWFGNVEDALKLKRDRKWHEQTRFGYCRADETIAYVSRVQTAYDVYARHMPLEHEGEDQPR